MATQRKTAAQQAAADETVRFVDNGETLTLAAAIRRVVWRTVGRNYYCQIPTAAEARAAGEIEQAFRAAAVGRLTYGFQRVA